MPYLNKWKLHLLTQSHDEEGKVCLLLENMTINENKYTCHPKEGEHSYNEIESCINDISESINELVLEYLSHCDISMKDKRKLKKAYNNHVSADN